MKNIEILKHFLAQEATRVGWAVKPIQLSLPPALRSDCPRAETEGIETRAFVAGLYIIILADLGSDLTKAPADWAAAQRQAAVARTTVAADSGEDLVLILVGPPGSRELADWRALTMEIERNDLVCRKLVWLPPKMPADNPATLKEFVRRTFLSRPWLATDSIPQIALDTLSEKNAALSGWEEILDRQPLNRADVDYDDLVGKLINAHEP
jgi:hypothetical protein